MDIETLDDWNARLGCCCHMPGVPDPYTQCFSRGGSFSAPGVTKSVLDTRTVDGHSVTGLFDEVDGEGLVVVYQTLVAGVNQTITATSDSESRAGAFHYARTTAWEGFVTIRTAPACNETDGSPKNIGDYSVSDTYECTGNYNITNHSSYISGYDGSDPIWTTWTSGVRDWSVGIDVSGNLVPGTGEDNVDEHGDPIPPQYYPPGSFEVHGEGHSITARGVDTETFNFTRVDSPPSVWSVPGVSIADGTVTEIRDYSNPMSPETLVEAVTSALSEGTCPYGGECQSSIAHDWPGVDLTLVQYRWHINPGIVRDPVTHAITSWYKGSYYKITWQILHEPAGWNATMDDPDDVAAHAAWSEGGGHGTEPEIRQIPDHAKRGLATRSLSAPITWEWTPGGPVGDPTNEDAWRSELYTMPLCADPLKSGAACVCRVVNVRFIGYRSPYGSKPQVTGEYVDPSTDPP